MQLSALNVYGSDPVLRLDAPQPPWGPDRDQLVVKTPGGSQYTLEADRIRVNGQDVLPAVGERVRFTDVRHVNLESGLPVTALEGEVVASHNSDLDQGFSATLKAAWNDLANRTPLAAKLAAPVVAGAVIGGVTCGVATRSLSSAKDCAAAGAVVAAGTLTVCGAIKEIAGTLSPIRQWM